MRHQLLRQGCALRSEVLPLNLESTPKHRHPTNMILRPLLRPSAGCRAAFFAPLGIIRLSSSSASKTPPTRLRILFAGSDDFSGVSLAALHREHVANPSLITSIDVLCREDGRTGRKRDVLKEGALTPRPPSEAHSNDCCSLDQGHSSHLIAACAYYEQFQELGGGCFLPSDCAGTDQQTERANLLTDYDLIIAVSFGLFIPARLISGLPYGGLNVHPSLLPRYRGAAPLHHTLLNHDAETGVTIQTLHPKRFDHGDILMQTTPPLPLAPRTSFKTLHDTLAAQGAEMLVETLRRLLFVPPLAPMKSLYAPSMATKMSNQEEHIVWERWTADEMELRAEMLGSVWTRLGDEGDAVEKVVGMKRTVLGGVKRIEWTPELEIPTGSFRYVKREREETMVLKTNDGWVSVGSVKVEGKKDIGGATWIRSLQGRGVGRQFF